MKSALTHYIWVPFIIVVAGTIPLPAPATYIAAALAIPTLLWYRYITKEKSTGKNFVFVGDPLHQLTSTELQQLFELAIAHVTTTAKPALLTLTLARNQQSSLNLAQDGRITLSAHGKAVTFTRPDQWLADHPTPLRLSPDTTTRLLLTPTSGNRIRAVVQHPARLPPRLWLLLLAAVTTAAIRNYPLLLAYFLSLGATALVTENHKHGTV